MSVGINANLIYASIRDRNQKQADLWAGSVRNTAATSSQPEENSNTTKRALEYQQRTQDKNKESIASQSFSYANSLKASRTKAKETSLEKKKLQYSYKKISSQIIRSKTSDSARKAVAAARREVQRLKRLKNTGEYDDEELQISIEHAKSMEKIARKKAAHLQQEEMIERGHKGALSGLEEKEKDSKDGNIDDKANSEDLERASEEEYEKEMSEDLQAELAAYEELDPDVYYPEEFEESLLDTVSETDLSDMLGELEKSMEELLDEMGLSELENTMVAPDPNMSEDDLKMLKIKHRTREMKDIAKADGDYLKAIMDKYEKKGIAGSGINAGTNAAANIGLNPAPSIGMSPDINPSSGSVFQVFL